MKNFLKSALLIALSLVICLGAAGKASAEFNKDSIIDDSVFNDKSSMTAAQIDAFLNNYSQSCISSNSGFSAVQPTGYSYTTGYQYGGYVTAGNVIYSAAQAYDLNPQVLISTLEKEQNLIKGRNNYSGYCNNGDEHKYAASLGYGCPDSLEKFSYTGVSLYKRNGTVHSTTGTTCVNTKEKAGFSQQVIRAAWLLKFGQQRSLGNFNWAVIRGNWDNSDDLQSCYSGPMTKGTHKVCPSGSSIYYDGYRTIDGINTYMGTGATAALYWYTPHMHGNQLFVSLFEEFFGSTLGSYLLRTTSNATVYLVSGDDKYPIPDLATMNALYPMGKVKYVSSSYLSAKTTKPTLKRLVKSSSSSTIYFFDAGIRLAFNSCSQIVDYGMTCSDVSVIDDIMVNKFVNGPGMTNFYQTTTNRNYYIKSGEKREVYDNQSLIDASITPGSYIRLNESALSSVSLGAPVIRSTVIARSDLSGKDYLYYTPGKFLYLPSDIRDSSAFSTITSKTIQDASINKYAVDNSFKGFLQDSSFKYVLDSKGKSKLATPADWSSMFNILPDAYVASIPNSDQPVNSQFVKSPNSSSLYLVSGTKKNPISSWGDFINLHLDKSTKYAVLANTTMSSMISGSTVVPPGVMIKKVDSATVYLVSGLFQKRPLSSFNISSDLGAHDIRTMSASALNDYVSASGATSFIKCGEKNYVANKGSLYEVSSGVSNIYGFGAVTYQPWDSLACSNVKFSQSALPGFIKPDKDATIYQISNGTKHPIGSYSNYKTLGGTSSNTLPVSSYFAGLISTGSTVN